MYIDSRPAWLRRGGPPCVDHRPTSVVRKAPFANDLDCGRRVVLSRAAPTLRSVETHRRAERAFSFRCTKCSANMAKNLPPG